MIQLRHFIQLIMPTHESNANPPPSAVSTPTSTRSPSVPEPVVLILSRKSSFTDVDHLPPYSSMSIVRNSAPSSPTVSNAGASNSGPAGGWFETREAMDKEWKDLEGPSAGKKHSEPMTNQPDRGCAGIVSLRACLAMFFVLTLAYLAYEIVHIVLFLNGFMPSDYAAALEQATQKERDLIASLEARQRPWVIGQLAYSGLCALMAVLGLVAVALQNAVVFRVVQVWIYVHAGLFLATAMVVTQISPLAWHLGFLFMVLTLVVGLANLFAASYSRHYARKLAQAAGTSTKVAPGRAYIEPSS
ncbi:hypothetical protein AMAG_00256 [Allomyces macrogynus ATCC 38327]|uniref:Transmembrane protein n=1 Tax=Allomyces macrogynus (strain ATCC 38327) TaxID=578462 RepID=A0A0L0RVT8_ALLM3|nr:hypothetical protein AMAG_00256 [Allomyces macrogynus ATCC 38327]|eukprot:KNE54264.1 hypothetical protein AMAG_00256 [Allomyces macrogynus ATCC 38327]